MRRFLIFVCLYIHELFGMWAFELQFGSPKLIVFKWAFDEAAATVYKIEED